MVGYLYTLTPTEHSIPALFENEKVVREDVVRLQKMETDFEVAQKEELRNSRPCLGEFKLPPEDQALWDKIAADYVEENNGLEHLDQLWEARLQRMGRKEAPLHAIEPRRAVHIGNLKTCVLVSSFHITKVNVKNL